MAKRPPDDEVTREVEALDHSILGSESRQSFERLLALWGAFAHVHIEDERLLLEDYLAFLGYRDRLQLYVDTATSRTRKYLSGWIDDADAAYRAHTVAVDFDRLSFAPYSATGGWWWRRWPRSPSPSLLRASMTRREG